VQRAGGRALAVELDVTDGDSIQAGVARIAEELGQAEIAVNKAGWDA
jgi:NAD(P)-dependent dehydrogenase (short-subunit alcohol dehydrogenase family)